MEPQIRKMCRRLEVLELVPLRAEHEINLRLTWTGDDCKCRVIILKVLPTVVSLHAVWAAETTPDGPLACMFMCLHEWKYVSADRKLQTSLMKRLRWKDGSYSDAVEERSFSFLVFLLMHDSLSWTVSQGDLSVWWAPPPIVPAHSENKPQPRAD